jgi:signal transduction histidine kinase
MGIGRRYADAVPLGLCALLAWLIGTGSAAARPQEPPVSPPPEVTNLSQLRQRAEQHPAAVHPFRIVAEVCDVDGASGVLVLRDASGLEFIKLDLNQSDLEPGATVCLEGKGCGVVLRSFGLAVVPGTAVDNDGLHPMATESGTALLQAGSNPLRLEWFNGPAECGLTVEYAGPDLPRQRIPDWALSRAPVDPATGPTKSSGGLDYRCYEGHWRLLPDFRNYQPVSAGVATNFDVSVRSRNEDVGLEFSGLLTVPRSGAYTFYLTSDDGSRLWIGEPSLGLRVLKPRPPPATGQPATSPRKDRAWATLVGTVSFVGLRGTGGEMQMRVGNDDIHVGVFEGGDWTPCLRTKVKVSGIYKEVINEDGSTSPGMILATSWKAVCPVSPSPAPLTVLKGTNQPVAEAATAVTRTSAITSIAEIKALSPELARQQLPVFIRGVVTTALPDFDGAVIQDSTRGIFVYVENAKKAGLPLQRGECYQIEGVTGPGLFAPVVVPRKITHLGAGQWPQPLRATWAELVNGSLDTQYVEIDGVVTAVRNQDLSLLTEGGKVTLNLIGFRTDALAAYSNAVVRIRGCVLTPFNERTRELQTGTLPVGDGAVSLLQPAPRDLFDVPQKSIGELLLYDPAAAPFRRLKVSGTIIHARAGEYLLCDGTNGLRVTTRSADRLAIGDLVEAVGFLGLSGPAAELQEAVMRKLGRVHLPPPAKLAPDQLLLARYADTRVQVEATLMNQWREGFEQVLELQSGFVAFRARLHQLGRPLLSPRPGSRLELTGVYAPLGTRLGDGNVSGFELLLLSPKDVRVVAAPPWWTWKHLLGLAGVLAALLCAAMAWNKGLHRKVLERSRQLEAEIRHRERAEQQRAAEAERTRIARDLHDELGAGLTEVSLLASAGLGDFRIEDKGHDRFRAIAGKARALVSALDVIVWAIDPKRNSLQSFADYLGSYAEELLSASNIVCRFRIPIECEAAALSGAARHSLFLAFKEALNNVIRHASATEVELQMKQFDHRLEIAIADNGRGFEWNAIRRRNGLANLQARLEALGGQCQIASQPGSGTTVKFIVSLPNGVA